MGFSFNESNFHLSNPHSAGQAIRVNYEVDNTGPDDPGHNDYVQVWGPTAPSTWTATSLRRPRRLEDGTGCSSTFPPSNPVTNDISVTPPDGTAAGSTTIVQ